VKIVNSDVEGNEMSLREWDLALPEPYIPLSDTITWHMMEKWAVQARDKLEASSVFCRTYDWTLLSEKMLSFEGTRRNP
jgi:hypothetical protein